MTDARDPPRLVDPGSPASARLRALIESSRADVGTDAEVRKLEAMLAPALWPGEGAGGSIKKVAKGAGAKATVLKATVGALVVASAGGLWLTTSRAPMQNPKLSSAPAVVVPRAVVESPPAPGSGPAAPSVVLRPEDDVSSARKNAAVRPAASVSESELLGQAQAALSSDPARALALSDVHRRQFAGGVLVQEREVIAIEALARLGRRAEAKARGARFLSAFPGSAHRSKIESIVGGT